jgi:hypothetical protein
MTNNQITITKQKTLTKFQVSDLFGQLVLGYWNLFDVWDLVIVI